MSEGVNSLSEAVAPGIWLPEPGALGVEEWVLTAVLWLKLGVEAMGALIIGIGVLVASYQFIRALLSSGISETHPARANGKGPKPGNAAVWRVSLTLYPSYAFSKVFTFRKPRPPTPSRAWKP